MMKRIFATLVAAGVLIPASACVASNLWAQTPSPARAETLAQAPSSNRGRAQGDRAERLMEALNLTEEQAAQIRAIREEARANMRTLHDSLRTERKALHDLMAGDATEAELRAQHAIVQARHQEASDQRFETMLATREILTPEQRAELAELMEQRRQQRGERGVRGGQAGPARGDRL